MKVWYRGQEFSCARCFKTVKQCPGNAVASKCQLKDPTLKITFDDYWEIEKAGKPFKDTIEDDEEFETETLKIYSFPKDASRDDVHAWLVRFEVHLDIDKIKPTNTPTAWFLTHCGKSNMKSIMGKIDGQLVLCPGEKPDKRKIHCVPVGLNTPLKKQLNIREPIDTSFEKNDSASVQHFQPSEQDIRESGPSGAGAGAGGSSKGIGYEGGKDQRE